MTPRKRQWAIKQHALPHQLYYIRETRIFAPLRRHGKTFAVAIILRTLRAAVCIYNNTGRALSAAVLYMHILTQPAANPYYTEIGAQTKKGSGNNAILHVIASAFKKSSNYYYVYWRARCVLPRGCAHLQIVLWISAETREPRND